MRYSCPVMLPGSAPVSQGQESSPESAHLLQLLSFHVRRSTSIVMMMSTSPSSSHPADNLRLSGDRIEVARMRRGISKAEASRQLVESPGVVSIHTAGSTAPCTVKATA